jgi:hypothetical protein
MQEHQVAMKQRQVDVADRLEAVEIDTGSLPHGDSGTHHLPFAAGNVTTSRPSGISSRRAPVWSVLMGIAWRVS